MLQKELKWFFPESLDEAEELLKLPGVILHAGGTRILKTQPKNIKGLIDISSLKLNFIHKKNKTLSIGAGASFSDIVAFSRKHNVLALLGKSLANSASAPLRNRITVGGSLKDFPLWTSLYAPLIALNTQIEICVNNNLFILPVEEYFESDVHKVKHIITRIIIKEDKNIISGVKRFSLIRFEYPLFNIAAAFVMKKKIVSEARFVITGVKTRFKRFKNAENVFVGNELNNDLIDKAVKLFNPKFADDYKYSSEYKGTVAKVYFKDILTSLIGGSNEN
jgi:Aerobic-type carbon monoxide dehydrogenase, middle subunit CoxM/CutM homologs